MEKQQTLDPVPTPTITIPQPSSKTPQNPNPRIEDSNPKPSNATVAALEAAVASGTAADLEKKLRRAERFGAAVQLSEEEKRRTRAERLLKEIGSKLTEKSVVLMPKLLQYLKHDDPVVVRQSVTTGTSLFCAVLTEMALQLRNSNKVDDWLEDLWSQMLQFKEAIRDMLEHGSIGSKVLATKFLETCVLLFTSDGNDSKDGKEQIFNTSWLVPGHPTLNPAMLAYEASKILALFMDILRSARILCGSLVITSINCLASIAKRRPVHYEAILSLLLDFDPNFEISSGGHAASIQYAVRLALLGFLRCTHSSMFESRDKLLRVLRSKYPGEGTEQTIRQMEKMSRGIARLNKDDPPPASADLIRERPLMDPGDGLAVSDEAPSKRARFSASVVTTQPVKSAYDLHDTNDAINDVTSNTSNASGDLSPAEKMIVAIGAILAEGDKGAQSLELLLSQIDADLLADIVIETMKHLPKSQFSLSGRNGSMPSNSQAISPTVSLQPGPVPSSAVSGQSSAVSSEIASTATGSTGINLLASDIPSPPNFVPDFKRDPRRDPRRLDPRRAVASAGGSSISLNSDSIGDIQCGTNYSSSNPTPLEPLQSENDPMSLMSKIEPELSESSIDSETDQRTSEENLEIINGSEEIDPPLEGQMFSDLVLSPIRSAHPEFTTSLEIAESEGVDGNMLEPDQYSSSASVPLSSEDFNYEFPVLPHFVELTSEQKKALCKLAITRLREDYKQIRDSGCGQSRLPLFARLVAQIDADNELVTFFQKHIILDYHHNKGHDLVMHVLYHLHAVMISDSEEHSSLANNNYEKFLLAVAKTLLDSLPASDKSFSRLLGEAPFLPESAFKLLEDLCQIRGYENHTKDACDGDRVTQGLGAVWSLILGRPPYRQICLDIALKCSVYSHDEVRAKAIRLVANKLFPLPYASESIEKFARSTLFPVADKQVSEPEIKHVVSSEPMAETGSLETSVSGSHNSELGPSESDHVKGIQLSMKSTPAMSSLHAQQQTSLFFSLCTKKPSLLHLVFNIYGRTPKVVKQSIHRHIPGLVRTLGPLYRELLQIISDPPEGSENLIMLVLQLITEESTPSADLIAAVKHLYDTKLKDVTILIPMLSSLSKDEVLPIFPRLVDLPPDKFQAALARILQGSAHTGPALTPVEVLVAIHDVNPAKDGVALKKITDACTACFEQRTVFTQHVLAKSLSHMVEQVPLPMLFMRTVIQAVNSFPALGDFVMGILSKLVNKQIWKMPKLWVGFLKLLSQTQPNSFNVLLQLPPPQLENALNKYANLRGPLGTYANQPNVRASLTRPTLQVLGLVDEAQQTPSSRPLPPATALHTSETSSSFHSATFS